MDYIILGFSISAMALLSASGAFILGFYLKYQAAGDMEKANPFRVLVIILSIPIIIIASSALLTINYLSINSENFLLPISMGSLLVTPLAYIGILIYKR